MGNVFSSPKPSGPSKAELEEQRRKDRAARSQRGASVTRIVQGRTGRNSLKNPGLFVPNKT